jgi:hypothetical protein
MVLTELLGPFEQIRRNNGHSVHDHDRVSVLRPFQPGRRPPGMTEDEAARGLPTCPATYLLRDGALVCTTCGAAVGGTDSDQIRHSTWHSALAALFAVADAYRPAV